MKFNQSISLLIKTHYLRLDELVDIRYVQRFPSPQVTSLLETSGRLPPIPGPPGISVSFVPPSVVPQIRKEFPETWIFLNNMT